MLYTLEEIGLHHQNIEKIELLGHLCRNLRTLHMQGNLIGKLENLHRLKVIVMRLLGRLLVTLSI